MSNLDRPDALIHRGLKLAHLRLMAALLQSGQIGLAAATIGIAQPAASRLLAEAERIVGAPVHMRVGRGIALTPVGAVLARRAQRLLIELQDAGREMAELSQGQIGQVAIGAVTAPALDLVLPALRSARLSSPGISAEVTVAPSDILCAQLLAGRLDFAIARIPADLDPAQFTGRVIAPEPVLLVVRKGHRLASAPIVSPAELLEYDWVMPGGSSPLGLAVLARLDRLGLPMPARRLSTASFLLTLALLKQSNSVAPLAEAVARQFAEGPNAPFAIVNCDLGIEVAPYSLLTRAGSTLTPAATTLVNLMLQAVGQHDAAVQVAM
ncbi:MAG: LysR family transcriptional regulator [Pseudomonadota bacterium]